MQLESLYESCLAQPLQGRSSLLMQHEVPRQEDIEGDTEPIRNLSAIALVNTAAAKTHQIRYRDQQALKYAFQHLFAVYADTAV